MVPTPIMLPWRHPNRSRLVVIPIPVNKLFNAGLNVRCRLIAGQFFQQFGIGPGCGHVAFLHVHVIACHGHTQCGFDLVDEIGQFIGKNTQMMLKLQTITENLGTICGGRAWVIVTSQADIDSIVGGMQGSKSQDFSKIQGRFERISLSSSNTK